MDNRARSTEFGKTRKEESHCHIEIRDNKESFTLTSYLRGDVRTTPEIAEIESCDENKESKGVTFYNIFLALTILTLMSAKCLLNIHHNSC